jgi:hypothetical protein
VWVGNGSNEIEKKFAMQAALVRRTVSTILATYLHFRRNMLQRPQPLMNETQARPFIT